MATLNDFKLVSKISKKYFKDIGGASLNLNELDKSRLGFYLFVMECVTNNRDLEMLKECIIDTEFRKKIFKEGNNDLGIDAVYIDEEERKILLFNFKYRENFKKEKAQELNDLMVSAKFLNVISSEKIEDLDETTKKYLKKIIEKNYRKE